MNLFRIVFLMGFLLLTLNKISLASFLPEGEWENALPPSAPSNISETEFKNVLASLQSAYAPVVNKFGGSLSISGDWSSDKLNAGSSQMGTNWQVVVTGAIARRPELNLDGFELIVCHEIGHHLGGFPFFVTGGNPFQKMWGATEGQADYFSTDVCAKKMWKNDLEKNASFRTKVSDYVRVRCDTAWSDEADRNLCYRISAAVKTMTETMAGIMGKPAPSFETPDSSIVKATLDAHPAVQCRLDTTFAGAFCSQEFGEDLIPGKNTEGGLYGLKAEQESARKTCTNFSNFVMGLRPACWFKARM